MGPRGAQGGTRGSGLVDGILQVCLFIALSELWRFEFVNRGRMRRSEINRAGTGGPLRCCPKAEEMFSISWSGSRWLQGSFSKKRTDFGLNRDIYDVQIPKNMKRNDFGLNGSIL